jgi:signal transduction histidine kinase
MAIRSRMPRLHPALTDAAIALVAAGLALAQMQGYPTARERGAVNVTLVLLQTLPLVGRRRLPFTVFTIAAAALGVQGALWLQNPLFAFLAVNFALYSLAVYGDHRLAVVGVTVWGLLLTVRLVHLIVTTWPEVQITEVYDVADDYVLLAGAWILGQGVRQRRLHAAELEDRAARLEQEREQKARQAVSEERLRIARELHDVVAHSVSVIGVQAGAARLVLDSDATSKRARDAVASIEATANQAMAEMRRALGILRETDGASAALAPLPGLRQLPTLLDQIRAAGLPVDLTVTGEPQPLPTSIDLSLYRIVQESLTNVLKHANATHADVVVRYGSNDVEVEIADDGRGPSPSPEGSQGAGTIGMHERAALFGGQLRTGHRAQGGYCVTVRIPVIPEQP